MTVSKRLRFEVLNRDNHACRYCGACAPDVKLTIDHVVPVALGGLDDPSNLVTACADCNAGKSSSHPDAPLIADVSADAIRWADAMWRASLIAAAEIDERNAYERAFFDEWKTWRFGQDNCFDCPLPDGARASIGQFYEAGLSLEILLDAMRLAMRRTHVIPGEKFRYMCGIAWSKLSEIQEQARLIVSSESMDGDA